MKLENIGFYTLEDDRAKCVSKKTPLWRCELLITSKCNFKCPYCRGTNVDADITFNQAKYVVDLWAKERLRNVRFSGGEPTCVKWLPDLVEYTKKKKVIKRIAISTNGSNTLKYYKKLIELGVNDFSISLDACCAGKTKIMTGGINIFERLVENIKELSKLTYVTVGMVFTQDNVCDLVDSITFASDLGVADIRIISAAQYNQILIEAQKVPKNILEKHPILKYRIQNILKGRNVRGIKNNDCNKCPLMLDDMVIRGNYHYPCVIKMREGCAPIGRVSKNMREERETYFKKMNTFKDPICRKNCLDVCIDYNNKYKEFHNENI